MLVLNVSGNTHIKYNFCLEFNVLFLTIYYHCCIHTCIYIHDRVFSIWDSPVAALVQDGINAEYSVTIQYNDQHDDQDFATDECVKQLKALPFPIIAVIPGAETGVELADRLSSRMGLRTNGEDGSLARRNKYLMGEKVRSAGVRAVMQHMCTNESDLTDFLAKLHEIKGSYRCVVKPVQSAGTDDVFLCSTKEEAYAAFKRIFGKRNGLGLINEGALAQEFLQGKEYVIDKVSRDGVHKVVCIWEYDKRSVNDSHFVYFGMRLKPSNTPKSQEMIAYADKVLDALGIMNGPSHMEVIYQEDGPCLVEVGSRCHGGEGSWVPVARECVGYTVVDITLDAYLSGKKFADLEKDNFPLVKAGREVDMVSRMGGVIRAIPGDKVIRALPSFRSINWEVKPGDYVSKTIDCFTRPGSVQLVHETEEQAEIDLEAIHNLEAIGLFDYSIICPTAPIIGAVVIVDPFSTGANLAAMAVKWGFKLIIVFSEIDSPVAKLVSADNNLTPTLMIQHDSTSKNQDRAILDTINAIKEQGAPVLAILPGAETGVELAEMLATRYGTRSNGEGLLKERRNKYLMQEAIRERGIRAIGQKLCRSEQEVEEFIRALPTPLCVVKPNESAGTDSVYLCRGKEGNLDTVIAEAIEAFRNVHGQLNGLGKVNDGALVQEFLSGTEYVLDGVCRDGLYKITAIWEYDKRSVNGANFVYFGMKLIPGDSARAKELIDYGKKIVKALGVVNGPSHMELMYCADGPCLVEVGSRCHGGEGSWLPVAQECVGYTQVEACLSSYLRPDRFDMLPLVPTLLKQGREVFLVSRQTGILQDIPGLQTMRNLKSFR